MLKLNILIQLYYKYIYIFLIQTGCKEVLKTLIIFRQKNYIEIKEKEKNIYILMKKYRRPKNQN